MSKRYRYRNIRYSVAGAGRVAKAEDPNGYYGVQENVKEPFGWDGQVAQNECETDPRATPDTGWCDPVVEGNSDPCLYEDPSHNCGFESCLPVSVCEETLVPEGPVPPGEGEEDCFLYSCRALSACYLLWGEESEEGEDDDDGCELMAEESDGEEDPQDPLCDLGGGYMDVPSLDHPVPQRMPKGGAFEAELAARMRVAVLMARLDSSSELPDSPAGLRDLENDLEELLVAVRNASRVKPD